MQYLLLQEIDASHGGGTAPGVVAPEAQTTTIDVIFKHLSFFLFHIIFLMHVLVLINLLNCLIFTIFEFAGTPLRT